MAQRKVILDTNFIISCIKNRIDFFEELKFIGFEILVPAQVIEELKKLSYKSESIKFALKLLKNYHVKIIDLKVNYVDEGIARFCSKNRDIAVATLDKELQDKILRNPKVIIRNKKQLEVFN